MARATRRDGFLSGLLGAALLLGLIAVPSNAQAQQQDGRTVQGTVTDAQSGDSTPGVNVLAVGTQVGTATGADGQYELDVPAGVDSLRFSAVGYAGRTVAIGGRAVVDVALRPEAVQAEEVVVTALGVERSERALGYAVEEVDGAEITDAPEPNPINALKGRVAGLQVSNSATGAGGSSRVTIRGSRSLIGGKNEPLYVIDGVPISSNPPIGGLQVQGGNQNGGIDYGGGISNVNPEDIASITVLKGPNAAALYGSRGANGAIIITTKKGTERTSVSFSSNTTFQTPLTEPNFQNTYGRGTGGRFCPSEAPASCAPENNGGVPGISLTTEWSWGPRMEGQDVRSWTGDVQPFSPQPDFLTDFLETGYTTINNLSFSTGTSEATVRASISNMQNSGFLPSHELDRTNVSLQGQANLMGGLSVDGRANYMRQNGFNRPRLASSPDNVIFSYYYMPRSVRLGDLRDFRTDGGQVRLWNDRPGGGVTGNDFRQNPFFTTNVNTNEDEKDRLFGYLRLQYDFTDWLSGFVRGGTDFYEDRREDRYGTNTRYKGQGQYTISKYEVQDSNFDFLLTGEGDVSDDFSARMSVGGNFRTFTAEQTGTFGQGLNVPNLFTPSNLSSPVSIYDISEKEVYSAYALGRVGFRNWAFLDLTARNDWSSTLPDDNNSYFYPSATGTFIFTDAFGLGGEDGPVSFLDYGKLRASVAQVGSDTDPYRTNFAFSLGLGHAGQPFGSVQSTIPAVDLEPEITTAYEIGTNLRFLEERIAFDATVYRTDTKNQIINIPISQGSGFASRLINAGLVRNQGLELSLQATPIEPEKAGGFGWDVYANWAANQSEIKELAPDIQSYFLGDDFGGVVIAADLGEPFGDIRGRRYARTDGGRRIINPETGLPVVDQGSFKLGNFQPDWTGGVGNTLRFRGVSLSALVDFRRGGDIFSLSNAIAAEYGTAEYTLEGREEFYDGSGGYVAEGVVNVGTEENPQYEENTQAIDPQAYWQAVGGRDGVTEEFVYDGSYVILREATLGYALPSSLLGALPVRSAKLSLVGRNLFYFHKNTPGFAPESGYSTGVAQGLESFGFPLGRALGFSLDVQF